MKTDLMTLPDQPLRVYSEQNIQYITADIGYEDPSLDKEDVESVVFRQKKEIKIPNDRQLIRIGPSLVAMPKNMESTIKKIDRIGQPDIFDKARNIFKWIKNKLCKR